MTGTSFVVSIAVETPIIFGRRSNLDAILAALLVEKFRLQGMNEVAAIDLAHRSIPLDFEHGVYLGSSALIPSCKVQTCTFVNSLQRHINEMVAPEQFIRPNDSTRKNGRKFDGLGTPIMNQYEAHDVHQDGMYVRYLGRGDHAAVADLLASVEFIGKKRSIGYGKVKTITCELIETYPNFGLMTPNGTILRPVPKSALEQTETRPTDFAMAFESVIPPYWKTAKQLCYVPPRQTWPESAILSLLEG
jgi:hypothetical protein